MTATRKPSLNMRNRFEAFLIALNHRGNPGNDELVQIMLPLLEEIITFHRAGKVAPLQDFDTLLETNECLDIDEVFICDPRNNTAALDALKPTGSSVLHVTNEETQQVDIDTGVVSINDETWGTLSGQKAQQFFTKPVYLAGYRSYELALGHHDALTDIYLLGLIMASVATGLNFYVAAELKEFLQHRHTLQELNPSLHPSLANLTIEMTELDRSLRSRDLDEVVHKLKAFREYNPEQNIDLTKLAAYKGAPVNQRRQLVFQKLRSRLFDSSRRNRLLYFKSNMRFLNLTVASFPLSLNLTYVKPEHLFYWNDEISGRVRKGQSLHLNKYLKTDENEYIIPSLDKIRLETQKDIQEYGMSQLRLAVAFLHWYNLKDGERERISSPFILVPVTITKKKSLRKDDDFILETNDTEAEINPILRWMLNETYGIRLPEQIDLEKTDLPAFYEELRKAIETANQGIRIALIDKPRIKIIHTIAQRTASVYARRSRKRNAGMDQQYSLDYSYDRDNYQPLGLQLFRTYLQPQEAFIENVVSNFKPSASFNPKALTEETKRYEVTEGNNNPFLWEFDLCHAVLGNFNYRKMSLVRDYNEALETGSGEHIFNQLFSEEAKEVSSNEIPAIPLGGQYPVVQNDPTQMASVLKARAGKSYIIQGPPGTGKSQTITNLIADLLAQNKKVLFVCEKKAAIDVVYHRLKSKGLHTMCCLIHDSQADKREFIADLKTTYESYLKGGIDLNIATGKRAELIQKLNVQLVLLDDLHQFSGRLFDEGGKPVYQLLNRLLELQDAGVDSVSVKQQILPGYKAWLESGVLIAQLNEKIAGNNHEANTLATHPARFLNAGRMANDKLTTQDVEGRIRRLSTDLKHLQTLPGDAENMAELSVLIDVANGLREYASNNQLFLLDATDQRTRAFEQTVEEIKALQAEYKKTQESNKAWNTKLPESEARNALPHIERLEQSFFKFLNGTWRRISKAIRNNYDFNQHQIRPSYADVVKNLLREYELSQTAEQKELAAEKQFGLKDLQTEWQKINDVRRTNSNVVKERLKVWKDHPEIVTALSENTIKIRQTEHLLSATLRDTTHKTLAELGVQLEALQQNIAELPSILHYLQQLDEANLQLQELVRNEDITPSEIELLLLKDTLQRLQQQFTTVEKLNATIINQIAEEIGQLYDDLLEANADYIKATGRDRFMKCITTAQQSTGTLSPEERQLKRDYTEGRKILEHEFGKSRAHKSIRTLAEGSTGIVLRDIKPVWLMSPLSVSNALPLGSTDFDVVVFDEASQITLEEGIPTMFRAPQSIIVGDEKQMPPSNFFSSNSSDPDDLSDVVDTDNDTLQLDADSLLTQGARKLDSIMLGWHYRSRNESLISFSNAAFYKGELLTIPDRKHFDQARTAITVTRPEDADSLVQKIFARTISYHHLPKGIYESRSNMDEAAYIAHLIRAFFKKNTGKSIGIVAFSMEQQGAIEDALEALQKADEDFNARLEEEYLRTDEGQFTGIFIKNLENVQGDERDIIIISTCYGYNREGKMLMNFGPINRKGGEKRLNVIFSRAKEHVVVVSSIKYTDIKNEYNEGANFFRRYLQYAELVSNGDMQNAALVLKGLNHQISAAQTNDEALPVVKQLKVFLESEGWEVALGVGQSVFKCSLAVKKKEDNEFRLGLLVDDGPHYDNRNILEQYVQRPAILKSFGWKVQRILTKDWINDCEKVKAHLLKELSR